MSTYRVSELLASTNRSHVLDGDRLTIVVDYLQKDEVASILEQLCTSGLPGDGILSMHFEHLRSDDALPPIDIYLGEHYIDSMALYGIAESSAEGPGQDRTFDVTEVFATACRLPTWSTRRFDLTLLPEKPLRGKSLTIARVALYYHEF